MNKLQKYAGWISTLIMICVWLVTVMWYGRLIKENTKQVKELNTFYKTQLELNGKIIMYIELDSK